MITSFIRIKPLILKLLTNIIVVYTYYLVARCTTHNDRYEYKAEFWSVDVVINMWNTAIEEEKGECG